MTVRIPTDERVLGTVELGDATTPEGALVITNPGVPTQIANPNRTTKRSVVQLLVALFLALPTIVPVVLGLWSPEWLVVVAANVLSAQAAIVRIMALPGVNEWIAVHLPGLAPIPLQAIETH